jgi:glucosamine--fructose-6-phosphate aminotransferase (isomerizing)
MCGIFGAIGKTDIYGEMKIALEGLSYRGYDSAGIAALHKESFDVTKCVGHPEGLEERALSANVAIGHNRWATHGFPDISNAHPHLSNDKKIALVHNGIVENYLELKEFLEKLNFNFYSETDTEIIPNLIQHYYEETGDLYSSVNLASKMMHGAYAIVFMHLDFPDELFVVKLGSPICVGLGNSATYISSDMHSLPISTKKAVALDDSIFVRINKSGDIKTVSLDGTDRSLDFDNIEISKDQYNLDGYNSFLEKEISEQPVYSKNVIAGRILPQEGLVRLSGISSDIDRLVSADEIIFTGCGSALLAAQIGAYSMETLARKRCRAISAGELKYFNAVLDKKTVMIAVSQSGETADTLGCIKAAKNHGALTLGIVNVPNSSIAREVSSGVHIRAGQEVSVASTKAVMNQVISLISLAALVASKRDLSQKAYSNIVSDIYSIPGIILETVKLSSRIKSIATLYADRQSMLCIGRDILEPVAKEAALKIKEISYIHAEGYSASELKHGPLALITKDMPTIAFGSSGLLEDKLLSNIMEIKSRGGPVISILDEKCGKSLREAADHTIIVPSTNFSHTAVIPRLVVGQLFALHLAELNKRPVDRPRNLAKSVTVE